MSFEGSSMLKMLKKEGLIFGSFYSGVRMHDICITKSASFDGSVFVGHSNDGFGPGDIGGTVRW
jgi:hypothetical protein